jgi:glutaredoxin
MKITIYGAEWCPWCTKVEEFLKEKGFEFESKDVDEGNNGKEVEEVSGQTGIPVTLIVDGDKKDVVIGFDIAKLRTILKIE